MNIEKINYKGNPNIGVFMFSNDKITLVPKDTDDKILNIVAKVLGSRVLRITLGGMNIVGIFVAGNNKGLLLSPLVREDEYRLIKSSFDGNVAIVKTRFTAVGNVILVNDRAAYVHPDAFDELKNYVKEYLEVEIVEKGTIAEIPTVGSAAYVNNIGGIVHPEASDREIEYLSNLFGVKMDVGTVNFGIGFIRSGLVGNNRGLLVGDRTTGPEIMRISKIFG
ncbi:translation initiation factor eIF-6 [Ignisphaera aggregans DSM 17230]|uniref:Translation initiation factor 6 n=1 Tax=Ignisphaera aggregans (strain DSM 17230 / JCM 13409 / AQ1.S1) TaxID=583356 RepID=E0SQF9_IGNAA|nr:translation initiation factor eIF-6 [Ignisphaera aggregans DSM 17230]